MSRRSRSKRSSFRPAGTPATVAIQAQPRIVDVAASFESQIQAAAIENAVAARAPYAQIQTIVPGANYKGKPSTAEAHARIQAMKKGEDPFLNKKFETAQQAREYRRREGVEAMSPKEYEAETSNMRSSRRYNPWVDSPDTEGRDPETGRKVMGFNPSAFSRGAEVIQQLEQSGVKFNI